MYIILWEERKCCDVSLIGCPPKLQHSGNNCNGLHSELESNCCWGSHSEADLAHSPERAVVVAVGLWVHGSVWERPIIVTAPWGQELLSWKDLFEKQTQEEVWTMFCNYVLMFIWSKEGGEKITLSFMRLRYHEGFLCSDQSWEAKKWSRVLNPWSSKRCKTQRLAIAQRPYIPYTSMGRSVVKVPSSWWCYWKVVIKRVITK